MIEDLFLRPSQTVSTELSARHPSQTPEHFETLRSGRQHGENVCWPHILRHTTRHSARDPPAWLTVVCVWTRLALSGISICSVFLSILFQLICSNWLKCEGRGREYYVLFQPLWLILSSEYHASTSGASLVYIPAPSPDWGGICPRTILIPFVAQHQLTRRRICSDRNLSRSAWPHSIQALDNSAQLFSLHSQDRSDEFYHSPRFNNQPPPPPSLCRPNSSSLSPPPVNPAPSPPTRELPLLLLGLCDNNNNCVAAQRAFCWASARPAGTGSPLSLFYHLQPIPLCLGWRWSITGIKAAINVLSSRGHRHHSRTRSIFSLSASLALPLTPESNSKKRFYWQDK